MAALRLAALALVAVAGSAAHADPVVAWRPIIAEAAARFAIPAEWIEQVLRAESGGRRALAGAPIVSRAGAMGLMQLMPGTWDAMRRAYWLGADPHDPHDNIIAGAAYLAAMYRRFGYPGMFAAYNAGPERYVEHLSDGRALPAETRAYLAGVESATSPGIGKQHLHELFFSLSEADRSAASVTTNDVPELFIELGQSRAGGK